MNSCEKRFTMKLKNCDFFQFRYMVHISVCTTCQQYEVGPLFVLALNLCRIPGYYCLFPFYRYLPPVPLPFRQQPLPPHSISYFFFTFLYRKIERDIPNLNGSDPGNEGSNDRSSEHCTNTIAPVLATWANHRLEAPLLTLYYPARLQLGGLYCLPALLESDLYRGYTVFPFDSGAPSWKEWAHCVNGWWFYFRLCSRSNVWMKFAERHDESWFFNRKKGSDIAVLCMKGMMRVGSLTERKVHTSTCSVWKAWWELVL